MWDNQTSEVISVVISGVSIGIHGGGDGRVTWQNVLQVADVVQGAEEGGGGMLKKNLKKTENPHLAMCRDPEGNEFMLRTVAN